MMPKIYEIFQKKIKKLEEENNKKDIEMNQVSIIAKEVKKFLSIKMIVNKF